MYENPDFPTNPGRDMNVTPESDAPIIPKLTKYHLEARLPVKKVSFLAPLEVKYDIVNKTAKYPKTTDKIKNPLILLSNLSVKVID